MDTRRSKGPGPAGLVGVLLMGGAALVAVQLAVASQHSATLYGGCAVAMLVGVCLFRVAARRERAWRQANPFKF